MNRTLNEQLRVVSNVANPDELRSLAQSRHSAILMIPAGKLNKFWNSVKLGSIDTEFRRFESLSIGLANSDVHPIFALRGSLHSLRCPLTRFRKHIEF